MAEVQKRRGWTQQLEVCVENNEEMDFISVKRTDTRQGKEAVHVERNGKSGQQQ